MNSKLVIIFSCLLILITGCVAGYYFLSVLPQKGEADRQRQEQDRLAKEREQCRKIGQEIYEKDIAEAVNDSYSVMEPRYQFNETLNTCLYSSGLRFDDGWQRFVKDAYTNKTMLSVFYQGEPPGVEDIINKTQTKEQLEQSKRVERYWKEHEKLFPDR